MINRKALAKWCSLCERRGASRRYPDSMIPAISVTRGKRPMPLTLVAVRREPSGVVRENS